MADDSYAQNFTEYVGKSIAEAMQDENPVYEQIVGAGGTFSFDAISISLQNINNFVIQGQLPNQKFVIWYPVSSYSNTLISTYCGKCICVDNNGTLFTDFETMSEVENRIENNVTFGDTIPIVAGGAPLNHMEINGVGLTLDDAILPDNVPADCKFKIADNPSYSWS